MDAGQSSRALYDVWASEYPPVAHNAMMCTEQAVVGTVIRSLHPARALDVGTGSGRYLPHLRAAGAALVVGLDFSRAMLGRGPRCGERVCADARSLPFPTGCFDLVNASLVAGDIADLAAWLRELAGVLAPGGHLVYSDFHPSWQRFGWRRTFQSSGGATLEVPYVPHGIDEHLWAVRASGLETVACHEVPLSGDGTGVRAFHRRFGSMPVVAIVHARKTEP